MLSSYFAYGLGIATLLFAWSATRTIMCVLTLGPIYAVLIWGEEKLSSCFALRFPRSLSELLSDPQAFFGLIERQVGVHPALRAPHVLPACAQLESCSRLRELTTEVRTQSCPPLPRFFCRAVPSLDTLRQPSSPCSHALPRSLLA